jgi:hypothetical protein
MSSSVSRQLPLVTTPVIPREYQFSVLLEPTKPVFSIPCASITTAWPGLMIWAKVSGA